MKSSSGKPDPRSKAGRQIFFDRINHHLDWIREGDAIVHLNYGYAVDESPQRALFPAPDGDSSTELVLQLIGSCPLVGRDVVDIGCGRGGTVRTILECFPSINLVIGCDLSYEAIKFCRRTNRHRNADFVVGDAERLPFSSATADVVINIESACCYPDVFAFYSEVSRILRPGGRFLYADSIETSDIPARVDFFSGLKFAALDRRDVTRNVMLACERRERGAAASRPDRTIEVLTGGASAREALNPFLSNLIALPGSHKFEKYAAGQEAYLVFDLLKPLS